MVPAGTEPGCCRVRLEVPFYDLDPLQVVWHGNYFKYFELARQKLFDACGLDMVAVAQGQGWVFPVVKTSVKYIAPLRFRDTIEVCAYLEESSRRIIMAFEIRRLEDNKLCARARSEQVAVGARDGEMQFTIPEPVRSALLRGPAPQGETRP